MTASEFRAELDRLGLRQRWLAERLGIEKGTVNRWATGKLAVPKYVAFVLKLLAAIQKNYPMAHFPD